jgi:FkbM family methyltransferase
MRNEQIKNVVRAIVPRTARNWLRSPSKSIEWVWDSTRFSLGTTETLDLRPGWSVVCHPHARKVFYQAQVSDPEQSAEFRNFVSHCSKGMFLYDIGAHYGIFSLAAAHFGGRAVAVDPSPTATRMIARHVALNSCSTSVRIICAAASDAEGKMGMLDAGVFTDGYFRIANARPKRELTQANTVTIDQMVHQFGVPTHIKIDVEGHEAAVLRGAVETLRRSSPILFIELHNEIVASEGGNPRAALEELSQARYSTFALSGEVIERSTTLDRPIVRIIAQKKEQ